MKLTLIANWLLLLAYLLLLSWTTTAEHILVLICLLIVTEAKLAWLKQPWSFSSEKQQGAASDKVFPNIAVSEI